eukprot:6471553-Pyramimonas_sp.AAC.1
MRLDMEARLGMQIDPSMDIWPWIVRRAGWVLERYHVKANHRTAYEDSYGKAYQGEVLKFGEAALFKLSVTATGKIRGGVRQGRADDRLERGIWLGKTIESDEH